MTLPAYTLRPSFRAALITFLVHQNPFYLLSALCMLAGCYALNSGLGARTGDLSKLLTLVGVLNAYEAILIALGLYLIGKRGVLRDGRTLLLLEAPFLVDLAFLDAEIGSVSVRVGCILNLLVLLLALIKTAAVLHALWGRLPRRLFGYIALSLSVLFLTPSAFRQFEHHGWVSPGQFYMAWWAIGGLLILFELLARFLGVDEDPQDAGLKLFVRRLYITLPIASLVLHLSLLHWVYRTPFVAGDLAPLLIGGAFVLGRNRRAARGDVRLLRALMPLVALVITFRDSPDSNPYWLHRFDITPMLLVLAAGYATYVYCFFFAHAWKLLAGGAMAALLFLFGPTLAQIQAACMMLWQRAVSVSQWIGARSAVEWGVAAMTAAFAFLALGASISLRKEPTPLVKTDGP